MSFTSGEVVAVTAGPTGEAASDALLLFLLGMSGADDEQDMRAPDPLREEGRLRIAAGDDEEEEDDEDDDDDEEEGDEDEEDDDDEEEDEDEEEDDDED